MLKKQVENLIGFFMFPYSGFEGAAGPGRPAREQKWRRFLDFPTWPAAEDGLTKAGCWCQRCVLGKQARGEGKTSGLKPESQQVLTELKRRISAWAFSESKLTVMKHVLSTWLCVFVKLVCWKSENIPVFCFFVFFSVTVKKELLRDTPAASKQTLSVNVTNSGSNKPDLIGWK